MSALLDDYQFVDSNGVQIAYSVVGPADGSPVLFFHGISSSRYAWTAVVEQLAANGKYRIYVADARGHGNSARVEPEHYTMARYAADGVALLRHVGKPSVLVGHSLGGVMSFLAASQAPELVKAVLLEDPPLYMLRHEVFTKTPYFPGFQFLKADIADFQTRKLTPQEITDIMSARPIAPGSTITFAGYFTASALQAYGKSRSMLDNSVWDAVLGGAMADHNEDAQVAVPGILLAADPALGPAFFPEHKERLRKAAPKIEIIDVPGARHQIHDGKSHFDLFCAHLDKVLDMAFGGMEWNVRK